MLISERIGNAQVFTIDREDAGNAMAVELADAMTAELDALAGDPALRALVITGRGDRFFCAGGDVKRYRALTERADLDAVFMRVRQLLDRFEALPVPVIAAVNGYAIGGGAEMLVACDIRFADAGAKIGFPQARLGIAAGWYGFERLARDCGYVRAMRLAVSGELVSAAEAERIGLINEVVTEGTALQAALSFAAGLEAVAPLALAATKRALQNAYTLPRDESRRRAEEEFAALWFTEDHREAEAAFAERRQPVFRGR